MEFLGKLLLNFEFLNSSENVFINAIFYTILGIAMTHYWIKMDYYEKKLKKLDTKISNSIIKKLKIKKERGITAIQKIIRAIEFIITGIIFVLILQSFFILHSHIPTGSMEKEIMTGDRVFVNMAIYKFRKPRREEIINFKEPMQNKDMYCKRLMGLPGETVSIKDGYLHLNGKKIETRKYSSQGTLGEKEWIIPKKGDKVEIIPITNYNEVYKKYNLNVEEIQNNLVGSLITEEIIPNLIFKVNGLETGPILDLLFDKKIIAKLKEGEKVKTILESDYYLALGDNTNSSLDSRMWGFVKENKISGKCFFRIWPLKTIGILK